MASRADYDVIVIGAGVEGSATAYNLAKTGYKTLLVEQFYLPHTRGSSHGQSRITRKAYPQDYYAAMMIEAFDMWSRLEKESCTGLYQKTGLLVFGPSDCSSVKDTAGALEKIRSVHQCLSGAQVNKQFPMFNLPDDFRAVFDPEGGILKADKCLNALQTQFQKYGGVIKDGHKVEDILPGDIVTVKTAGGDFTSQSIVITAGPWTSDLVKPLGVHLPLRPIRIAVFYWKSKEAGSLSAARGMPTFLQFQEVSQYAQTGDIYGLPAEEYCDQVKVCLHWGPDIHPDRRDVVPPGELQENLMKVQDFVRKRLPGLEDTPSTKETCIYTMTPDEDFILDTHPTWKNIVIGAGFSGHGFKLAPVVGKVLGELATKRHLSYNLKPFQMSRFFSALNKAKI